ncbi:EbsA family protein [Companilactobacillus sp. DQM5]|uniref:EbsA family protein n=1 Tax=Companilactobacillus sp. DQM5 TaxID=3463359 RepID=UPI00405987C2
MKFRYQSGGEKGIITWSLITSLFFLGIIVQMEIFKATIISPIIIILAIIIGLYIYLKSQITVEKEYIKIQQPFRKKSLIIKNNEIKKIDFQKYYFVIYFKSDEFFPMRLIALPRNIVKFSSKINLN